MASPRPFRFGVQLGQPLPGSSWAETARKAEDLGFSTLAMPDHFGDQLAPLPALMAAAAATTTLRVGALVFDNDYKHPVVMAKEIATIDVLSGGRVEFGIGAGWMASDYQQAGMPYDEPRIRVDRFEEALAIFNGLWSPGMFEFSGAHYTISALDGLPKPVQAPRPPILIGAGGKRMLGIAAREADIVGINPNMKSGHIGRESAEDATAAATDRKVGWLREAAGDRWDALEINCAVFAFSQSGSGAEIAERIAPMFVVTPDEMLQVPHALLGSVDEMCDALHARRERWGMSYITVPGDTMERIAPVIERLAGA